MTTGIVMSVTDELVAELERECRTGADDHGGMGHEEESALFDRIGDVLLALMAERAELKRDAERYRWLRVQNAKSPEECSEINDFAVVIDGPDGGAWIGSDLDAAIDAAMQSEAKP